jgi:uncharacterized repeat protein (TIGR03803 family)
MDAAGNLYGTTYGGGSWDRPANHGTVFKLAHTNTGWVFTPLHIFDAYDGAGPSTRVIFGPDGALYGTTSYGGNGYGTVYRLQPPAGLCPSGNCPWTATVLYSFHGASDGWDPEGDLALDQQGNIYGTTEKGGVMGCYVSCGVVFKLTRSGGSWSYSVIYSFQGDDDGGNPFAGVVRDASGNLYGIAGGGPYRTGIVFKLTPSGSGWTKSMLYDFANPGDGSPSGGLIFDRSGNLYGTTWNGGEYSAGTVYELTSAYGGWNFAVLASVPTSAANGPQAKLFMDGSGNLYGTAWSGLIFKLTLSGNSWILTELGNGDLGISSSVVVDSNGAVYGTNAYDGDYGDGSVFEITQ